MKKNSDSKKNKQGNRSKQPEQSPETVASNEKPSPEQEKDGSAASVSESGGNSASEDQKSVITTKPESGATTHSDSDNVAERHAQQAEKSAASVKKIIADDPIEPATDNTVSRQASEPQQIKQKRSISGIIAIILVILLAGAGYYFYLQLSQQISASSDIASTTAKITQQLSVHDQSRQAIAAELKSAQQQISSLSAQLSASGDSVTQLQDKLLDLSGRRPNDWLLAEANYLVKLAGRKLWQERDQQTASSLLATADLRIAEMNDPSLIKLRKALAQDIAALQSLPKDKTESTALRIDGLISQVDNLKLNAIQLPESEQDATNGQLSSSPADWQENISKTWHSFIDEFITIRRRTGTDEPLMSPKQQWYLEENLKSKLLQSQLALYRHQQDAFAHAIELATRWVMQFYDRKDSTTEFMLKEFAQLQQLEITIAYPKQFHASDLLYAELTSRSIAASNDKGR